MLADDLVAGVRALLFSAECADLQFCFGEQLICAHSLVLRARCPALLHACTMADGPHRGGNLRLLCVPGALTADHVEALLHYLYTDELCASTALMTQLQLLRSAETYLLPRLRELLVASLTAMLDVENAAYIYSKVRVAAPLGPQPHTNCWAPTPPHNQLVMRCPFGCLALLAKPAPGLGKFDITWGQPSSEVHM